MPDDGTTCSIRHDRATSRKGNLRTSRRSWPSWPSVGVVSICTSSAFTGKHLARMQKKDPRSVCLGDFQLRPAERFRYRYNFLAFWVQTSLVQHRHCAICSKALSQKGYHQIKLQTVFGKLQIRSPRLRCCPYSEADRTKSLNPLARVFPERATPERLYLATLSRPCFLTGRRRNC